jgi:hypothetical protein
MLSSDSTTNGISIVDLPAGKRFDMSYANGFVDFTVPPGGSYRFDDTIVTKYIAAGTANNDTLHMMATTRPTPTQSGIQFGVDNSANGVRAGYWDMRTGYLGVNTRSVAVPLHVRNLRPGANAELRLSEDTTCGSCAARLSFENNGAVSGGQIFVGSTTNAFMPRGMMIHTLGADGLKIATNGAAGNDIEFAGSVFIGTSSWGRFKGGTGDFLYNTTTDDPANGKFQIHSTSRFDSLMKLYNLALPPSTYNVLVHGLTDSGVYQIPVSSISGITSVNSETGPAITVTGGTAVSVGTTTNTVTVNVTPSSTALPHTLDAQFTTAGNSGTAETDLYSYTLPANKLLIDGRTMNFEIDGEFNDATATAQLKLYIAGNVTLNTSAIVISTAFTAWRLRGYLIRTSTTTAHVTYELQSPGLATPLFIGYSNLTSLDFTTTNIFKVTAQAGGVGGGTDDITAHSWQVLYKPQPQ